MNRLYEQIDDQLNDHFYPTLFSSFIDVLKERLQQRLQKQFYAQESVFINTIYTLYLALEEDWDSEQL